MLLALVLLIVIVSRLDPPVLMLVGANDLLMATAGATAGAITCVCALVQLYVVALQLGPGTPGVLLPFGLVDSIGPMTPVIVAFIAYTFFALEALGAEIEDPFGEAPNDLALNAMAHMIETSLLEMVNEKPRTIRPEVKDFVLL